MTTSLRAYAKAVASRVRLNGRLLMRSRRPGGRLIIVGDSHAFVLNDQRDCFVLGFGPVTLHRLGRDGELCALLQGRFRGNPAFRFPSVALKQQDVVLVSAGEIDVRCHLDRQIKKRGGGEPELIEQLVHGASRACALVLERYGVRAGFLEIPPPVRQLDSAEWPVVGTLVDRVRWTGRLNQRLATVLGTAGLPFVPIPAEVTDVDGTLRQAHSDGSVHIHPDFGPLMRDAASFLIDE